MKSLQYIFVLCLFPALSFSFALAELPDSSSPTAASPNAQPGSEPQGWNNPDRPHRFGEMFRKCRENPSDEQCVQMREKRRERFAELRQKCQDNPNDAQCERIKERREGHRAIVQAYCQEHPSDEHCVRIKEHRGERGAFQKAPI